jgi:heme-degrading monooxygenase HmoA
MATTLASGNWIVREGSQAAFVSRRSAFLESTAAAVPGFRWALLLADGENPRHFISVAGWDSVARRQAWRAQPSFPNLLRTCRELCEEFRGADYSLVAAVRPAEVRLGVDGGPVTFPPARARLRLEETQSRTCLKEEER